MVRALLLTLTIGLVMAVFAKLTGDAASLSWWAVTAPAWPLVLLAAWSSANSMSRKGAWPHWY